MSDRGWRRERKAFVHWAIRKGENEVMVRDLGTSLVLFDVDGQGLSCRDQIIVSVDLELAHIGGTVHGGKIWRVGRCKGVRD